MSNDYSTIISSALGTKNMMNIPQRTNSTVREKVVANGLNQRALNLIKVLADVTVTAPDAKQKFAKNVDYAGMEVVTAKTMPTQND